MADYTEADTNGSNGTNGTNGHHESNGFASRGRLAGKNAIITGAAGLVAGSNDGKSEL